jgi:hypothetical protein
MQEIHKESYAYATKELQHPIEEINHTQSSHVANSSRGGKKGSTPPTNEQRSAKLTSSS